MSLVAQFIDGKLVTQTSTTSTASSNKTGKTGENDKTSEAKDGSLDKDAFLQLLVAQMKYQDPLEPTSNTEYISQFATFSELEEMQNMSASSDLSRASTLVGKNVIIKQTEAKDGKDGFVDGRVDYVVYENNKAYLSINETLYSIDKLDTVMDETYLAAFNVAKTVKNAIDKLPAASRLTLENKDVVESIEKIYSNLSDYQKSFFSKEYQTRITDCITAMNKLTGSEGTEKPETNGDNANGENGENSDN